MLTRYAAAQTWDEHARSMLAPEPGSASSIPSNAVEQLVKSPIWLVWEREELSL
jgi:hypothetical protein